MSDLLTHAEYQAIAAEIDLPKAPFIDGKYRKGAGLKMDTLNPATGETYRLFQESFNGPWKPGHPLYEEKVLPTSQKEELYLSVLTVNADPGRWIRNLGCLFVVLGIATMFYMRAYFFKPRRRKETETSEQSLNVNPEPAEIS